METLNLCLETDILDTFVGVCEMMLWVYLDWGRSKWRENGGKNVKMNLWFVLAPDFFCMFTSRDIRWAGHLVDMGWWRAALRVRIEASTLETLTSSSGLRFAGVQGHVWSSCLRSKLIAEDYVVGWSMRMDFKEMQYEAVHKISLLWIPYSMWRNGIISASILNLRPESQPRYLACKETFPIIGRLTYLLHGAESFLRS